MSRALVCVLVPLLLLPVRSASAAPPEPPETPASRPTGLEVPDVDLAALQRQVTGKGCAGRLLGKKEHPFSEAQAVCDALLSFTLVQASLEARAPEEVRERLDALLADALGRGRAPFQSTGSSHVAGLTLPRSVLYRGLLLLMLAGKERAGLASEKDRALFDALAAQTVAAFTPRPLLPSFGERIWPCDNALAASGLILHGRLRGQEASRVMGERIATHLVELARLPSGFPTRVDAQERLVEKTPRGTALAWTTAFLAMSGHPAANELGEVLLRDFCERVTLLAKAAACREWPRGVDRPADAASGPIIGGYGQGATALAIAATRASEEWSSWHADLRTTALLGGIREQLSRPERYPLETSLYLWATTLKPW